MSVHGDQKMKVYAALGTFLTAGNIAKHGRDDPAFAQSPHEAIERRVGFAAVSPPFALPAIVEVDPQDQQPRMEREKPNKIRAHAPEVLQRKPYHVGYLPLECR